MVSDVITLQELPKLLHLAATLTLAFTSGISACMSVWIIPIISLAPPRTRVAQFNLTVSKGARYLQPSSRTLAIALAVLLYLVYTRPSGSAWDSQSTLYTVALFLLLPIGLYEIYFIFPVNDRVLELGKLLERQRNAEKDGEADKELVSLFHAWRLRNWGRAGPALAASLILAFAGPPVG